MYYSGIMNSESRDMNFSDLNNKIYAIADLISEQLKPYTEMMKVIEQNVKNALESFAEKTKPLRAFYILAEHQFTYWLPLDSDDIEMIIDSGNINKYLAEKIDDKTFIDYDILCNKMFSSLLLSNTNKAILAQAIQAIDNNLYDLALIGIVTVFDGVLSAATNNTTTSIKYRINEIRNKIKSLSDEKWESLEETDITAFGMYITWTETMKGFQEHSDFNRPDKEPSGLNRHWISHGRKTLKTTKLDCCKMINALYGLIYFGGSI